jgi:head-tail adaptor
MLKGRNIGRMDVLLTIEQPTKTRNSINEDEITWTTYGQFYAERVWTPSGEKFEGKQEVDIDGVIFNARYNPGIDTTMRLKQGIETTYFYINNTRSSIREGLTIINAMRRDNQ